MKWLIGFLKYVVRSNEKVPMSVDLDAMGTKSVYFKFNGKTHRIEPINVFNYYACLESLAKIAQIDKNTIDKTELAECFYNVSKSSCKTISKEDIMKMEVWQISAFINLIVESVTGKVHAQDTDQKKKIVSQAI